MGQETIADFLFKLGFDAKDVNRGLDNLNKRLKTVKKNITDVTSSLGKVSNYKPTTSGGGKGGGRGKYYGAEFIPSPDVLEARIQRVQNRLERVFTNRRNLLEGQFSIPPHLQPELNALEATFRNLHSRSSGLKSNLDFAKVAGEVTKLNQEMGAFVTKVKVANGQLTTMQKISQRISHSVLNFAAGFGSAFAAFTLAKEVTRITNETAGIEQSLNVILGSSEKASASLKELRDAANENGFSFGAAAAQYRNFLAASKDTLGLEKAKRFFIAMNTSFTAYGASVEQTKRANVGLAQIFAKGTVSMEELRQQISESGAFPDIFIKLAQAMGMSQKELQKMIADGKLSATVFADKLLPVIEASNKELAKMQTPAKSIARLNNQAREFVEIMGKTGFTKGLVRIIDVLTAIIENLKTIAPLFGGIFDGLSLFFTGLLKVVEGFTWLIRMITGNGGAVDALVLLGQVLGILLGGFILMRVVKLLGFFVSVGRSVVGVATSMTGAFTKLSSVTVGGGGFFARLLGFLPKIVSRFIPIIGWAWLLYDVLKLIFGLFDKGASNEKPRGSIDHSSGLELASKLGRESTIPSNYNSATAGTTIIDNSVKNVEVNGEFSQDYMDKMLEELTTKNNYKLTTGDI